MRKFVAVIALLMMAPILVDKAVATTYSYVSLPLSDNCSFCVPGFGPITLTGSVSFNFDTSNFSGSLFLTDGDQANLRSGSSFFDFPADPIPPFPTVAEVTNLSGDFTLLNGVITSWNLSGSEFDANCGIGFGCANGQSVPPV